MKERVLLTGITGYIGQHCAAELLRQGFEVVGTIRSRSVRAETVTRSNSSPASVIIRSRVAFA